MNFNGAHLVYYLVKKLKEKYPTRQVSKMQIQKLMYLLSKNININLDFENRNYGPHSVIVNDFITVAEALDLIAITNAEIGFDILPVRDEENLELDRTYKDEVDRIVEKYGRYTASSLVRIIKAQEKGGDMKSSTLWLINSL